jgi:hypothetical protein
MQNCDVSIPSDPQKKSNSFFLFFAYMFQCSERMSSVLHEWLSFMPKEIVLLMRGYVCFLTRWIPGPWGAGFGSLCWHKGKIILADGQGWNWNCYDVLSQKKLRKQKDQVVLRGWISEKRGQESLSATWNPYGYNIRTTLAPCTVSAWNESFSLRWQKCLGCLGSQMIDAAFLWNQSLVFSFHETLEIFLLDSQDSRCEKLCSRFPSYTKWFNYTVWNDFIVLQDSRHTVAFFDLCMKRFVFVDEEPTHTGLSGEFRFLATPKALFVTDGDLVLQYSLNK